MWIGCGGGGVAEPDTRLIIINGQTLNSDFTAEDNIVVYPSGNCWMVHSDDGVLSCDYALENYTKLVLEVQATGLDVGISSTTHVPSSQSVQTVEISVQGLTFTDITFYSTDSDPQYIYKMWLE